MTMEKTFDAARAEPAIFARWMAAKAFAAGANAKPGAEPFCIMIPPPNVTGSLHMGHAFNNTLQDILTRWHRMRGFDVLWQPGQDHAGIATQLVVEKQLAAAGNEGRRELGREAFVNKVWAWKEQSGGTIVNQLQRLGCSADWDRNAFTMDKNFHDAVLKVFVDLYNKGLIYRGKRLVNWDPHFETAISDLEVENIERDGHMWHFKYPLAGGETYEYVEKDEDGNVTLRETRDYISIATTRPETMLGDGAVAVHPDDERYAPIVGKLCEIPVGPKAHRRLIPIITDDYPDMNFGSGAVKITGAHDFNDYGVAQRNGIPCYRLMDTKGAMRADGAPYAEEAGKAAAIAQGGEFTVESVDAINLVPDEFRGLDRFEARKRVVEAINAEGLAVMVAAPAAPAPEPGPLPSGTEAPDQVRGGAGDVPALIPHVENKKIMQPFGDRSKVIIEPMLTDQWYVDAAKLAGPAMDAINEGRTQILPEREKKVYFHWMENIEPWCISRQLWWGHQVPVWYYHKTTARKDDHGWEWTSDYSKVEAVCAPSEEEAIAKLKVTIGDIPFDIVESEWESWSRDTLTKKGVAVWRDPDVLDTWFSSGLWPIGTLGWPNDTEEMKRYFPTSVLITGFDILFFWVARMMMMQLEVVDMEPFHTIYLHALVRDEKGVKMSKTLGNVIDPLDVIDEFGADALRFTMTSMAALGGTLKLSTERIAGYRNFGTKLWNAARFAEMNECKPVAGFDPKATTQTANKWIVGETARARAAVDAAYDSYRFNEAALALYAHVRGTFCDWYVEFAKPLLQSDDAAVVAETRATMAWALDQCLILLHPIMPYMTEQLWGDIAQRPKMLVHTDWPSYTEADFADDAADREMRWAIGLIEQIRSVRAEMHVNAGAKIPMLRLSLDEAGRAAYARNAVLIERLARIASVADVETAPKGAITLPVEGGAFCLPLGDIIDVAAEKARLEKSIAKLGGEMGGLEKKLTNEKFIANAPEEVVAENRERLAQAADEMGKLRAALDRMAAIG
ncbi:valine--tRNA ligase [Abyssibius alkaniclasticus]|uniref:valine--tRNA ligase n=1 Tax=Abyssibius alkaniclasticus TaxID=2881234 RepID=UPI004059D20D